MANCRRQLTARLFRIQNANWRRSINRPLFPLFFIAIFTVLLSIGASPMDTEAADSFAQNTSEGAPPNVGSVAEYMTEGGNPRMSYLPMLGLSVFAGRGELASGQNFSGMSVTSVDHPGPGDDAGIRAEHIEALLAAMEMGASVLLAGAILAFPPVMVGVQMIPQVGDPKAYDVIVAVDSERTRNINELENCLRKVKTGETIYLTIIRDGQRKQLRVVAPADPERTLTDRTSPFFN